MVSVLTPEGTALSEPETLRRPMAITAWLVLAYAVITRIGHLKAAKLGGIVAGVPIFLTEIFLMLSFAATLVRRPVPLLIWMMSGGRAGPVGRAVWLIAVLATIQFALAVSQYGVYAARDFAIYMYSLFFVLTYLAIRCRDDAVRLLRWTTYAGVVTGILLLLTNFTDLDLGLFGGGTRNVLDETIDSYGSGDVGGIIAFSLASLGAWVLLERRWRYFNFACMAVCFLALALPQTRSAVFGLIVASAFSMLSLGTRHRVVICCLALLAVGIVAISPALPDNLPGVQTLQNLFAAVVSGVEYHSDGNAQFRLLRWHLALQTWLQAPVFGVGFGTDILPRWLLTIDELNTFNFGMPHNTYLTILARTGVIGLTFFVVPIFWTLHRICRLMRTGWGDAHLLAVGNMICAMAGFGLFVLFFERPMHGATFWIVMAIAARMIEFAGDEAGAISVADMTIADDGALSAPADP